MKDITVKPDISIRQAMKTLNRAPVKCLIVIDENQKLLGTLTDGDIRRAILGGLKFSESIENYYCKKPYVLKKNEYSNDDAIHLLGSKKLDLMPILDKNKVVIDYISWKNFEVQDQHSQQLLKNVPVVVMAGGKGTRLEPFTKVLPKPLIPIQEKPIIEHIIERFTHMGCNEFYITVNYKAKIIKAYFEELQPVYLVSFVVETKPLGTAASLRYLVGSFDTPFFVTNCDIIIETDYTKLFEFHNKENNDITLVASAKEYIIPYGTCELNGEGHLSHINEKPQYDFLINTGLYVLNPDILKLIPENKFYHITHLIQDAKNIGKKVGVFPIDDDAWVDIGQWAEFRKTIEKF